ncbi:type I polyketide synthase [Micromonospora ureilytica]|uniref:Thioester reductase-like protein n=1 Tax=Micromonospora ureilytica TaxID=709868 RepID=A0ABS0JD96_9ACTN|nr:type I polyketide synthase [Micromonospora ureilytica]MBG6064672.1 thioester reductase-like protein [Micromonospora ureilytica]
MSTQTSRTPDSRRLMVEALRTIEDLRGRLASSRDGWLDEPIAIVGMACRFPGGAQSPEEFWTLLRNGVDTTSEFPQERADAQSYHHPDPEEPGKAYTIRGAFLDQVDRFEPEAFGISPREALGMDPQHRIALEICWEGLERAGYAPDRLDGSRTGVYFGLSTTDYVRGRQAVGDINDVDFYQLTGEPSFLAGRISYLLGLRGPSKVVDTSCSSSLVALHEACQALRLRECDLALAGGVNLLLSPYGFVMMSKFRGLSADGRCKTFDASADGYARGEGAGVVVLKRLSAAQADNDPIIAVIRGSAINHDGRSSGLTVPNPVAQQDVIGAAMAQAGVGPDGVDYVEAHGTGTSLGDPIELRSLEAVIGRHRRSDDPLLVGSVKTNIGHLEPAAGIAGLFKVVLAMSHGEIPPHLHLTQPNPNLDWSGLHVRVPVACTPWPERGHPRTGGVSSFGASGTNAHVVVAAPPAGDARTGSHLSHGLFLASARTEEALRELADRHARWLRGPQAPSLGDACYTTHVGRAVQAHGLAATAADTEELADVLSAYAQGRHPRGLTVAALPRRRERKVAWLFTGQGAQYPGMARGLLGNAAFRAAFEEAAALFDPELLRPVADVLWADGPTPLDDTRYTQPALFAVEYALAQMWLSWGMRPAAVAGHSVGELVAACVAGVLDLPAAATLVAARSRLMAELPPGGAMAAASCAEEVAVAAIDGYADTVALAAVNGPADVTISGATAHVDAVLERLAADGVRTRRLAVSHAFHSPLIRPMLEPFRAVLAGLSFRPPRIPLASNVTGRLWGDDEVGPDYWLRHAAGAVRFREGVRALHDAGARTFVELGPAPVLTTLATRSLAGEADCAFVPTLRRGGADLRDVLSAVGTVSLRGSRPDWRAFHEGEDVRAVPLPTTPWRGAHYWFREVGRAAAPVSAASPNVGEETGAAVVTGEVPGVGRRLSGPVPAYEVTPEALPGELSLGVVLDLAARAAADCLGGVWRCVEGLTAHAAVPTGDRGQLRLTVTAQDDGSAAWELTGATAAREALAAPWIRYASGLLRRRWPADRQYPDVDATTAASMTEVPVPDGAGWHEVLEAAGVAVTAAGGAAPPGPAHLSTVAGCGALGLARVDGTAVGSGTVPPGGVRAVRVRAGSVRLVDDAVTGSVDLLDGSGVQIGYAQDVTVAPVPAATPWEEPADLLYDQTWVPLTGPSPQPTADLAGRSYLLVADPAGQDAALTTRLTALLRQQGAVVTVAAPPVVGEGPDCRPDSDGVRDLVTTWSTGPGRPWLAVVMTGLDAPASAHCDAWSLEEYAGRADLMTLALLRELLDHSECADARLTVVTRAAMRVPTTPATDTTDRAAGSSDAAAPVAGTLWGLGRVLALEHPDRWGGAIDLDPDRPTGEEHQLLAALTTGGLTTDGSPGGEDGYEDQQALRADRRYALRLVPAPLPPEALRRRPPVHGDATYLITGAFGGIGLTVAEWLARAGAGRLVLLARTPLPERDGWADSTGEAARRVSAVRRLEQLGAAVDVVAADVVDEAAMTAVFAALDAAPLPLRGVVHAAGVSEPEFAREATGAAYRRVWRPKVIGGWLLHRLTRGAELDFFVGFSSIAATWGSQHLASYAAGNAFLDALAGHRNAAGLPALSVAWGPWDLPSALFGDEVMAFLRATGLRPLPAEQSMRLLTALAAGDAPQRVVCAVDWSVFKPVMQARTERPMLRGITVDETATDDSGAAPLLAGLRAERDPRRVRATLGSYAVELATDVLGAGAGALDEESDVLASGMDSLMVMDAVRRCRRDLGLTVRAGDLLTLATPAQWADLFAGLLADRLGDPAADAVGEPADDQAGDDPAGDLASDPAWIAGDVTLAPDVRVIGAAPARVRDPRHVLLTGATGFVGGYLLHTLLESTAAHVSCLVRCADEAVGLRRVLDNMERYLPRPAMAADRITVLPGDLGQPRLGLSADRYDELAEQLDGIYHCGARVHFGYSYQQLRPDNIAGTAEILRLAARGRPTAVHHVSTYGIWGLPAPGRDVVGEDDDIATAGRLVTGYVQTKWAAERLVELARARGVPVDIYRPGRVLGDSRTGASLTTHFTTRVMKGCVQLGMAPDIDIKVEMTPVDYVASALVHISRHGPALGGTYHLVSPHKLLFADVVRALRRHGFGVEVVPVEEWWQALKASYAVGTNELHPVMPVVEEFVVGGEEAVHYAVDNTEEQLRGTDVRCPPLDDDLLDTYLRWMVRTGYLPAPRAADKGARTT